MDFSNCSVISLIELTLRVILTLSSKAKKKSVSAEMLAVSSGLDLNADPPILITLSGTVTFVN